MTGFGRKVTADGKLIQGEWDHDELVENKEDKEGGARKLNLSEFSEYWFEMIVISKYKQSVINFEKVVTT